MTEDAGFFTEEQDQLISDMLDEGYTPERLSGYLARLNDLDDIRRLAIRQRAADMAEQRQQG